MGEAAVKASGHTPLDSLEASSLRRGLRERVGDWLTVENIRFELEPLTEGRTALTRTTVWRRHLAPGVYFGWLQQTVIQRGQARLLTHLQLPLRALPAPPPPRSRVATVALIEH